MKQEESSMNCLNNIRATDELKHALYAMKKISFIFILVSFIITGHAFLCEAGYEGTIGTQFTISGSGFGEKKPTVYLEYEISPGNVKRVKAKVLDWSDTSINCLWKKKISSGDYTLWVQPKIKGVVPIYIDVFSLKNPTIDNVSPSEGSKGDTVNVSGKFFTIKKPKVYLVHNETSKRKKCKVISSAMDALTGESTLQFIIPVDNFTEHTLLLITQVGEVVFDFTEPAEPEPPAPEPDPDPDPDTEAPTPEPTNPGDEPPIPEPTNPGDEPPIPEPSDPNDEPPIPGPSDPYNPGPSPE